jgi:cobalt-zinc-cadmium resistance protein CzcA
VLEVAKIAIGGDSATDVLEGQRRFAIFVRLNEKYRNQVEKLGDILVAAPVGGKIPLGQLASFKLSSGDSLVTRENSLRGSCHVQCEGTRHRQFRARCARSGRATGQDAAGYFVTWGGQFENAQQATRRLLIAIPIALLLVFVLIYSCFNSLRNTLTIIFNIPIALVGSTTALLISGFPLSVPPSLASLQSSASPCKTEWSWCRLLTSCAVVAMNYAMRNHRRQRSSARRAVERLIGSISLVPFIISSGTGAEIEKPLAIVVVGGMLMSPLKIVILPMIYEWVERGAARRAAKEAVTE